MVSKREASKRQPKSKANDRSDAIFPVEKKAHAGAKTTRPRVFTRDDAIFKIRGIGKSGIPGGLSSRKHDPPDRA